VTDQAVPLVRQKLAADVAALDALITQLAHDPEARAFASGAGELRGRLLLLLPVLSSLNDRMYAITREDAVGSGRQDLFLVAHEIADWIGV